MALLRGNRTRLSFSYLLLQLLLVSYTIGQDKGKSSKCIEMKTCGACLAAGPPCGWCSQPTYAYPDRCNLVQNLVSSGCNSSLIVDPVSSISYVKNLPPRNADQYPDAIQLSPQEITIKIRPNEPYKFQMNFRLAENYPVDLYYVMDLSNSMEDDKAKLAQLGNQLATEMKKITQNFQLGFGSFVDKKTMPYVSTVPEKLNEPCTGCAAPYGFQNQLKLTRQASEFVSQVINAPISGNLDSPEGGFDAIMQAISCRNEIGWRNQSRKILLFSTDAGFHYAGDGKLGGIVIPNDGHCHLDREGFYSESLNQDYPSISQISHRIAQEKVNVIFAVTENQLPVYGKLSGFIDGSIVGMLEDDSSNIVQLVKENYKKISGNVELKTEADDDLQISFRTRCRGNNTIEGESGIRCDGLAIGDSVSFDVTVQATACPADRNQWKKSFKIYPVALSEKLIVNVELTCECDCELPQNEVRNSPKCTNRGTYECGACTCNEGYYGPFCECDGSTLSSADYDAACKRSNTSEVCEGRGQCLCGRCQCNPIRTTGDLTSRFTGKYCECDDTSCDYSNGLLCGGPDHGTCDCGICKCKGHWTGAACDCSTRNDTCKAVKSDKICNGYGECVCGRCECYPESTYHGPTCEECPTCPGICDQLKPCVQCKAFKIYSSMSEEECETNCTRVEIVKELGLQGGVPFWRQCQYRDDDGCDVYFEYKVDDRSKINAQETKDCPVPVNILAIIIGVIIGIILIGLALLLIWKLLVTIHDRREFARFEKERENAKWDMGENPVYKPATTNYRNPTYANSH